MTVVKGTTGSDGPVAFIGILHPVSPSPGGILKFNPLVAWSDSDVWDHIREHAVPYNRLHDRGFPSIGCTPCTRAVESGEDIRAGRWWWEQPEHKECGLHAGCGAVDAAE